MNRRHLNAVCLSPARQTCRRHDRSRRPHQSAAATRPNQTAAGNHPTRPNQTAAGNHRKYPSQTAAGNHRKYPSQTAAGSYPNRPSETVQSRLRTSVGDHTHHQMADGTGTDRPDQSRGHSFGRGEVRGHCLHAGACRNRPAWSRGNYGLRQRCRFLALTGRNAVLPNPSRSARSRPLLNLSATDRSHHLEDRSADGHSHHRRNSVAAGRSRPVQSPNGTGRGRCLPNLAWSRNHRRRAWTASGHHHRQSGRSGHGRSARLAGPACPRSLRCDRWIASCHICRQRGLTEFGHCHAGLRTSGGDHNSPPGQSAADCNHRLASLDCRRRCRARRTADGHNCSHRSGSGRSRCPATPTCCRNRRSCCRCDRRQSADGHSRPGPQHVRRAGQRLASLPGRLAERACLTGRLERRCRRRQIRAGRPGRQQADRYQSGCCRSDRLCGPGHWRRRQSVADPSLIRPNPTPDIRARTCDLN